MEEEYPRKRMTTIDHLIHNQNNVNDNHIKHNTHNIKDLDVFLNNMYQYYTSNGIAAIILSQFCSLVSLAFTIVFSIFIIIFIDWNLLLTCNDEKTCHDVHHCIIINPFHRTPSMLDYFITIYFILLLIFWLWKCYIAIKIISNSLEMSNFYHDILGIKLVELHDMQWFEIVERLITLHNNGLYQICSKEHLTIHDVVIRIMRKDNYLIGLINKNVLDLYIPWWITIPFGTEKMFLTKSLEWSLIFCISDHMFDDKYYISNDFMNDIEGLKWRFQVFGLIHIILLPFILMFMIFHFFLENAQNFHINKSYLGPRKWSSYALWKFREFNELSHIFEDRMNKSYIPANKYIASFHNPYISIFARFITYISGAIVAILLVVSLLSEGALLYMHIADRNLLWYLGIFTAIYAGSRSLIPDETIIHKENTSELLNNICAHTHYFPSHWEEYPSSIEVKEEICELFQFKAQIFLMEVFSVVFTPIMLCFSLPSCASSILEFIRKHSRYVEGIGVVCDYSLFDFERYGDTDYGAVPTETSANNPTTSNTNHHHIGEEILLDGKLEKSFISFQHAHPTYEPLDAAAKIFNQRLHAYKDIKLQERSDLLTSTLDNIYTLHNSSVVVKNNKRATNYPNTPPQNTISHISPQDTPSSPIIQHCRKNHDWINNNTITTTTNNNHINNNTTSNNNNHHHTNTAENDKMRWRGKGMPMSINTNNNSSITDNSIISNIVSNLTATNQLSQQPQQNNEQETNIIVEDGDSNSEEDMDSSDVMSPLLHDNNVTAVQQSSSDTYHIRTSTIPIITTNYNNATSNNRKNSNQANNTKTTTAIANNPIQYRNKHSYDPSSSYNNTLLSSDIEMSHLANSSTQILPTTIATAASAISSTNSSPMMYSNVHSTFLSNHNYNSKYRSTTSGLYNINSNMNNKSSFINQSMHQSSRYNITNNTNLPSSILMSILKQENIDYENDIYWIQKFHHERIKNPILLEQSLLLSPAPSQLQTSHQGMYNDDQNQSYINSSSIFLPPFITNQSHNYQYHNNQQQQYYYMQGNKNNKISNDSDVNNLFEGMDLLPDQPLSPSTNNINNRNKQLLMNNITKK